MLYMLDRHVMLRLDTKTYAALANLAERDGQTVSGLIRTAVLRYLRSRKAGPTG